MLWVPRGGFPSHTSSPLDPVSRRRTADAFVNLAQRAVHVHAPEPGRTPFFLVNEKKSAWPRSNRDVASQCPGLTASFYPSMFVLSLNSAGLHVCAGHD